MLQHFHDQIYKCFQTNEPSGTKDSLLAQPQCNDDHLEAQRASVSEKLSRHAANSLWVQQCPGLPTPSPELQLTVPCWVQGAFQRRRPSSSPHRAWDTVLWLTGLNYSNKHLGQPLHTCDLWPWSDSTLGNTAWLTHPAVHSVHTTGRL